MTVSLVFTRLFFSILSTLFMIAYMAAYPVGALSMRLIIGLCLGGLLSALLIGFETLFKRFNLRSFNTVIVGLFFGYLMGHGLVIIFNSLVQICALTLTLNASAVELTETALLIFGTYLGCVLTIRFSDELYFSIPFVRFSHSEHKKKDLLLDYSALTDIRIVDLCTSGLLHNQLVLPRFIVKDLHHHLETADDSGNARIKKTLEVIKKLEALPGLDLRYQETDFPEIKDPGQKLLRLARLLEANILTGETGKLQHLLANDDLLVINLHALSTSLKPLTPPGENISIKVQRYGKEPKQGVGYLEDGTMVVINNGGDFIGEIIETQVISVKQTSAGRIIFTNAMVKEDSFNSQHNYENQPVYEHQHD